MFSIKWAYIQYTQFSDTPTEWPTVSMSSNSGLGLFHCPGARRMRGPTRSCSSFAAPRCPLEHRYPKDGSHQHVHNLPRKIAAWHIDGKWVFPKIEVPPVIIHLNGIFPDKPSSYGDNTMTIWKPPDAEKRWPGLSCRPWLRGLLNHPGQEVILRTQTRGSSVIVGRKR